MDALFDLLSAQSGGCRQRSVAYAHLRDAGLVVRCGTKFGADFLVYSESPDRAHADYAVLVAAGTTWGDVVRNARLCHGVAKELLLYVFHEPDDFTDGRCGRKDFLASAAATFSACVVSRYTPHAE